MRLPLLVLLVAVAAATVTGQTSPIVWNSYNPNKCCDNFLEDGEMITTYRDSRLTYITSVHLEIDKKYWAVFLSVFNNGTQRINVIPDNVSIRMMGPVNKTYHPTPFNTVAAEMQKRGGWSNFFDRWAANMATQQSRAVITDDNSMDSATVVVTERDGTARAAAEAKIQQREMRNTVAAKKVLDFALKGNSLEKDEATHGFVFFKKDKFAPGFILSITIDGVTYEIPFGDERKRQYEEYLKQQPKR